MNQQAAFTVAHHILANTAKRYSIRCDGHGSYSIETTDKELAMQAKDYLDKMMFMDYPIELLERPFFYRLH